MSPLLIGKQGDLENRPGNKTKHKQRKQTNKQNQLPLSPQIKEWF